MTDDGTVRADERRQAARDLTRQALRALNSGSIAVSTATRSMAPLLAGGEVLHWSRAEFPPRRGSLAIFVDNPGLVVHRVIGRAAGGGLRTKGDNRPAPDPRVVDEADLLGVVHAIECDGRVTALDGSAARAYALVATAFSIAGWWSYVPAYLADRVLARAVPPWGDRRLFRAPAFALQCAAQWLLHRGLYHACHRTTPALAAEPGAPQATTAPENS